MAPSQVQIATSALQRLLKEEVSYFKEQEQQEARIAKLEQQAPGTGDSPGNEEFQLKQEVSYSCHISDLVSMSHPWSGQRHGPI